MLQGNYARQERTETNVRLPEDLLAQAQRVTRSGETTDELTAAAVRKEIARHLLAQLPERPSGVTEDKDLPRMKE